MARETLWSLLSLEINNKPWLGEWERKGGTLGGRGNGRLPWLISMSVMVCHLFIATNHLGSWPSCCCRRQLKSMMSLLLSPPSAARTESRRGWLKCASGKRKDVMMTY